jgi:hypothetical protein
VIIFLFAAGGVALLAMIVCMGAMAIEARRIPERPQHMHLNPLNILADRSLWTAEIRRLNRAAVVLGLVFLACALAATVSLLLAPQ